MENKWRELPFTEAVQVNPKVSLKNWDSWQGDFL